MMQTTMGFVAQEDILLGSLTPVEALTFVSKLRQPYGITEEQRQTKIFALLKSMGLAHVKDSLIGFTGSAAANSGIKRGLSGSSFSNPTVAGATLVSFSFFVRQVVRESECLSV